MSTTQPRPKRAGEDYTRTLHSSTDFDGPSSSKKPRFDLRNPSALAPDAIGDDITLDADEIGRRGQKVRRNAVNIDGYESDSDNEGFDGRIDAKAKKDKEKEPQLDDDDDMFAELQEDFGEAGPEDRVEDKRKSVRFLQDNEIEGQVNDSTGGGTVSINEPLRKGKQRETDQGEESEDDDEGRAALGGGIDKEIGAGGKKSHVPLLDAFNMRAEQEEGRFDEAGNYVRKAADPDAIYDTWLDGVSKKDMRKAKEASERREQDLRKSLLAQDDVLMSDILRTLISHLHRGETIFEALARLGKSQKQRPKWQNKNKNKRKKGNVASEDIDMKEEDPAEVARKKAVEEITGAADALLSRGQTEIYEAERELLTRQYKRETGEDWIDPPETDITEESRTTDSAAPLWEFRWSDSRDGGETHGPYDSTTMESWNAAGYFGEGVEFRRADKDGEWNSTAVFT